jgi:hypothetical protein
MVMPRSRSISMESSTCSLHLALAQSAAHLDQAVGQRRLAVVDVGDDGEVADAGGRNGGGRHGRCFKQNNRPRASGIGGAAIGADSLVSGL